MAPKTVPAIRCTSEAATFSQKLGGLFCVGSFIVIWLTSLLAPFFLVAAIMHGFYVSAVIIIAITIASYAPWEKGRISRYLSHFYSHYHPFYYKSYRIDFEGSLPSDSDAQTFYAIHPHGAFCIGWAALFLHPLMSHVRFCFAPALYLSPFFPLFSRCLGCIGSASRSAMTSYLKAGQHVALLPGGFEEATLTCTTQDRVFIKKRTGFIRLCLQHGVAVRPVYVFGEKGLYSNIQGMWKLRLALNRYGIPTILAFGNPLCPVLPKTNVDMRAVVGSPLDLPKIENPTKEQVALWHGKYIAALTKLFEDHKEDTYGSEEGKVAKLQVW